MATVAARAPKRELAPDWRDALRDSLRRLAIRAAGALLLAMSLAAGLALATHRPTDPSLSTAAGGPPANWLGAAGAYTSDALLLLFGLALLRLLADAPGGARWLGDEERALIAAQLADDERRKAAFAQLVRDTRVIPRRDKIHLLSAANIDPAGEIVVGREGRECSQREIQRQDQ